MSKKFTTWFNKWMLKNPSISGWDSDLAMDAYNQGIKDCIQAVRDSEGADHFGNQDLIRWMKDMIVK